VPGYTASQNPNGTWNVHGVPVMGPLPAGVRKAAGKPNPVVDRAWMLKALAKSELRAAENYFGPAHLRHTGDDQPKVPVGRFRLTRVGTYRYEGKDVDALYADFLEMPAHAYASFKRGELPYRSVEVLDWDSHEVSAVAFLDTDTPFFRFGFDGIGKEIPAAERESSRVGLSLAPVTAFAAAGAGGLALFAFKDAESDESDEDESDDDTTKSCKGANHMGAHCGGCDEHTEGATNMPVTDDDTTRGAEMKALSESVTTLKADNAKLATENSQLVARLSALEANEATRATEKRIDTLVSKAKSDLRGWNFSARAEAHVKKLAAGDPATAAAQVDEFVALFKESAIKDPPANLGDAVGRQASEGDATEVAAFSAKGPDHLAAARRASAKFDEAKRLGRFDGTRAEFLAIQVPQELSAAGTGSAR
jgi:hypothetical protein